VEKWLSTAPFAVFQPRPGLAVLGASQQTKSSSTVSPPTNELPLRFPPLSTINAQDVAGPPAST
jgi:hypothetical protein